MPHVGGAPDGVLRGGVAECMGPWATPRLGARRPRADSGADEARRAKQWRCRKRAERHLFAAALGKGDVDAHLTALNANLKARSMAQANSINSNVPAEHGKVCAPADGGHFMWVKLQQDLDAAVALATAKTLGPSAAVACGIPPRH